MGAESATLAHAPAKHSAKQATRPAASRSSAPLREPAAPAGIVAPASFASIAPFAPGERRPAIPFNYPDLRLPLQRRLAIGGVDDPLEHEADTMAQRVMRIPGFAPHTTESINSINSTDASVAMSLEAPSIVHQVLGSPAGPLDAATRAFFEPRFQRDFSQVRLHTDAQAARSADVLQANAFTVGQDIVFGARQYAPDSSGGRELLAHELAHVARNQASGSFLQAIQRQPSKDQSWSERASAWYDQKKWAVYRAIIATLKSAKNAAMNALRKRVPQLPPAMQSAVMSIIDSIDFTLDMIIALLLAIIGLAVGFVEGIVGLVTGIVKLAYGLLKLAADYLWALFGQPEAYLADVNGIVAAVKGIPAGLSKVINGWLDRYKHANAEEQVLMGSELLGQIEALIASFAFSGAKAGQAANVTARTSTVLEGSVEAGTGALEKAPLVNAPEGAGPLQGASDAELDQALTNIKSEGDPLQLQPHGAASPNRQALGQTGKDVQSAHGAPQSVMKGVPGYNPNQALTRLMDRAAHTGMDRYWKQAFQAMQKAGQSQATAQEVEEIVAESIRRAPALSAGEKSSLIARLSDEMFVEYGLKPGDLMDLPYAHLAPK